jgi:sterol 3beta-glucosyltransferase
MLQFGSILVPDPNKTTRNVIRAVEAANVRAIIAKGWSSKGAPEKDAEGNEVVVEVRIRASC